MRSHECGVLCLTPRVHVVLRLRERSVDPVIEVSRGLITPETIEAGGPVRAVDVAVVADQLYQALKHANRSNEGPFIG